jgi:2-C-methyl-D-erythritol 4-phosphate cytidylyltransferase
VAGGSGRRFGGPKQFTHLGGRPVAAWSIAAARPVADGIVLVVPVGAAAGDGGGRRDRGEDGDRGEDLSDLGVERIVPGGDTRAASVRAGLAAVPDDAGVIVVHDAARPLASTALFEAVVGAVRTDGAAGAIPVLPVGDTLKRISAGTVASTVDREGLVTVQTPQAFGAAALRAAHRSQGEATDDAGLLEQLGVTVRTVPGEVRNVKITRPEDLELAELYVSAAHG